VEDKGVCTRSKSRRGSESISLSSLDQRAASRGRSDFASVCNSAVRAALIKWEASNFFAVSDGTTLIGGIRRLRGLYMFSLVQPRVNKSISIGVKGRNSVPGSRLKSIGPIMGTVQRDTRVDSKVSSITSLKSYALRAILGTHDSAYRLQGCSFCDAAVICSL
jgi:hypothetical protein